MITLVCSRCKLRLEVNLARSGRTVTCPACGTTLNVPKTGTRLPGAATSFEEQIQTAQERHRRHVAIALGAVILGAFFLLLLAIAISLLGGFGSRGFGGGAGTADAHGKGGGAAASGSGTGGQSAAAGLSTGAGGAGSVSSSATNPPPITPLTASAPSPLPGTNRSESAQPVTNAPTAGPAVSTASTNAATQATRPIVPTNSPPVNVATNTMARVPDSPVEHGMLALGDEFSRRLAEAGAKTGDVQISLMWNNVNDLDLHCADPKGEEIFYGHKLAASGGELDVDRNAGGPQTATPVENIYWPRGAAPAGAYRVYVNHFRNHGGADPTAFTVRSIVGGKPQQFNGFIRHGETKRQIHEFRLGAAR